MATLTDRLDLLLGDRTADTLRTAFELRTVGDLLRHYPRTYLRAGALMGPGEIVAGEHVTIAARVASADMSAVRGNPRKKLLKVQLDDGRNRLQVTFFSPHKVRHHIKPGVRGLFSGRLGRFRGNLQLTHPDYLLLPEAAGAEGAAGAGGGGDPLIAQGRTIRGGGRLADMARALQSEGGGLHASDLSRAVLPIYPATQSLQTWVIMRCVRQVLDQLEPLDDPLPAEVVASHGGLGLHEALRAIHFPQAESESEAARARLRFDEAAAMQLLLARRRNDEAGATAPACEPAAAGIAAGFAAGLPFELTGGQREIVGRLRADVARTVPMRRLLQGEVGSGKTVVALLAMLQVVDAGRQCALLAPTEVLAAQHARSIRAMLGPLARSGELGGATDGTRVALLTGSMPKAERRRALSEAASGAAGIVIGTHALLQDTVSFHDLSMVVVDEQHRFGVEQRDRLRDKAREGLVPHLLVMTATPIPRTVAMTRFGDLDTSTLRELPRGRSPISTSVVSMRDRPDWVARAWRRIVEEVAEGRQAYVVCARIGDADSEPPAPPGASGGASAGTTAGASGSGGRAPDGDRAPDEANAVVDVYDRLVQGALAGVRLGLLHGRLPSADKDAVMGQFADGLIDVLVTTTVVEVGVDVPNATVMVVLDAERFGVSQLHQLRGRIGRGVYPGLCILVSGRSAAAPSSRRLESVAATCDGFELARLDLQQRHEGDVVGAAQSGSSSGLRLLSVLDDEDVIGDARAFAARVIGADPDLSAHPGLAEMVSTIDGTRRGEFLDRA